MLLQLVLPLVCPFFKLHPFHLDVFSLFQENLLLLTTQIGLTLDLTLFSFEMVLNLFAALVSQFVLHFESVTVSLKSLCLSRLLNLIFQKIILILNFVNLLFQI